MTNELTAAQTRQKHLYDRFLKNIAEHELTVLKDDGLYRHLRMKTPGTGMYRWEIVTWPGYLAIEGDIGGGFCFAREEDMIGFFNIGSKEWAEHGIPGIDYRYWAEKLTGRSSDTVREHSPETFMQVVKEILEEHEDLGLGAQQYYDAQLALIAKLHELRGLDDEQSQDLIQRHRDTAENLSAHSAHPQRKYPHLKPEAEDAARAALDALWLTSTLSDDVLDDLEGTWRSACGEFGFTEILDTCLASQNPAETREELLEDARWHQESSHEAYQWLSDNEDRLGHSDTWEYTFTEYSHQFLLACWAINITVQRYLARQAAEASTSSDTKE